MHFYSISKAQTIINESDIHHVFKSIYTIAIIYTIDSVIDHTWSLNIIL